MILVEDDGAVRRLVHRMIQRLGFTVTAFEDPQEALRAVEDGLQADLLVTDVIMPGISGAELARQVAAIRPEMRQLFVSGYTGEELEKRGVRDNHGALLQKPFTMASLSLAVRNALRGNETTGGSGSG